MNFSELNLRKEILRAVSEMGFEEATDIQAESIPSILDGQDVTGRSNTGTGKTAAFGLPLVERTADNTDRSSVLILAPTRELALQITEEIRKFAKYLPGISVACIYGGQPMDGQIKALKKARIVVGTPGRVMDHMRRKTLKLDHLKTIVLDEADEMLNMGLYPHDSGKRTQKSSDHSVQRNTFQRNPEDYRRISNRNCIRKSRQRTAYYGYHPSEFLLCLKRSKRRCFKTSSGGYAAEKMSCLL